MDKKERIFLKISDLTKKDFVVSFRYMNYLKLDSMLIELRRGNQKTAQPIENAKLMQSEESRIAYILYLLDKMEAQFNE